nr:MAG TPA: hypothetical protein [Caudoviricetes sp.]
MCRANTRWLGSIPNRLTKFFDRTHTHTHTTKGLK